MKYLMIYLFSLLLFLLSFQKAAAFGGDSMLEYYGADHNEAEFNILGHVVIDQIAEPTRDQIDSKIRLQMRYMLGLMRARENQAAALYPKWNFSVLKTTKISNNSWDIKYSLNSKGVFPSGLTQYTFTLPYNPKTIFTASNKKCSEKKSQDSNFWYHWNPLKADCPLIENTHYFNATSVLKPIANTQSTYPEYEKLIDTTHTINATMFFGFEHYDFLKWTPDADSDWGVKSYNKQRNFLKSLGFTERVLTKEEVEKHYLPKDEFLPYIIEMTLKGEHANLRYRLILTDTGLEHNSRAFHHLLKAALANESVVYYNGHSGIGKNLDLTVIERLRGFKFKFNTSYQILFLGSCVPYAYYTDMFFSRKKSSADLNGTLNLDILSYAKEAVFANNEDSQLTYAFVKWAQTGFKKTYQEIIKSSPNYYFGINGDEDNSTQL